MSFLKDIHNYIAKVDVTAGNGEERQKMNVDKYCERVII